MSISNVKIYCFYLASPRPHCPGRELHQPGWPDMSLPGQGGTFECLSKLRIDVIIACRRKWWIIIIFVLFQVKELDLDGVKCGGELDFGDFDFQNLEFLSIREAQLTTLKNFPNLPNLSRVRHFLDTFFYHLLYFIKFIL